MDTSIDLLRTKHKNGENYYWLLYYSSLSPQQLRNVEEIIEKLRPHIRISASASITIEGHDKRMNEHSINKMSIYTGKLCIIECLFMVFREL